MEDEAMKEERKEHLKRLAIAERAKRIGAAWNPTAEDRRFLRSINVSPE